MKNDRNYIRVLSILAMIWSLAEIIFCIYSHKVSLKLGNIEEDILLAYDVQQCAVYFMVFLTGFVGIIASIKKNVWKISVIVGIASLLVSIAIPLMTRVPFNIVTIVFSIIIPLRILQVHRNEEK